jgi:hypothetical protein
LSFFFFEGGALSLRAQANEVRKKKPKKGHSVDPWMDLSRSIGMLPRRGSATLPHPPQADEFFFLKSN